MAELPPGVRPAFRLALRRPRIDDEVDAEIAFHLEMRAAELAARGMTAEAARAEARRRFGDTNRWRTAMRDEDRGHDARRRRARWLDDLRQDLHYAARSLVRAPLFAALAVATLALGIGANAAVFGVVKAVLLDRLPYAEPDRVVRLYGRMRDGSNERGVLTAGGFVDVTERQRSFARLAAFESEPRDAVYGGGADGGEPRVVKVAWVQPEYFPTLGVSAALGRALRADDVADTVRMVMLTHAGWQRLAAGDPGAVGRSVLVNGLPRTVVGVLPRGFVGPVGDADLYFPLTLAPTLRNAVARRGAGYLSAVARLRPGVTVDAARRDVVAIADALSREYPRDDANRGMEVVPVRDALVGDTRTPLLVLMASAGLVLLIACANLAGALLSRTITRRKEFAVRVALGAGRGRLVRQLLTESTALSLAGGAAGVALAAAALAALRRLAAHALPQHATPALDPGLVLFALALAVGTGLAFGLTPALSVRQTNAQGALRAEGRGASASRRSQELRGLLVAGQIALCVSLLSGAGLLARSLWAMTNAPLGFAPQGVLAATLQLPGAAYRDPDAQARLFAQLEGRLRALPGVGAAAHVSALPTAVRQHNGVRVLGGPPVADADLPFILFTTASDDYFRTMGIPLRAGRTFGPQDGPKAPPAAVISEAMARKFWPRGDALGGQFRMGPDPNATPHTVVGIVGDVRNDPARRDAEPMIYGPTRADARPTRVVLLRTAGDPAALAPAVRRELAAVDRRVAIRDARPLPAFLAEGLTGRRLPAVLMGAFGALALLLASVGVYAMFAAMAAAREREFGVRVALGSAPGAIAALVLRQGGVWMAVGLAAGGVGVVAVARAVRHLLYGVPPFDPVALGAAVAALVACGAAALLVPVRRAMRADPIATLR